MAIDMPWEPGVEPRQELALGALFDLAGMEHDSWLWRLDAACHGEDPGLFFDDQGGRPAEGNQTFPEARAVCRSCGVRAECLEHALRHERFGIWGGTSPRERTRLRRRMGIREPDVDEGGGPMEIAELYRSGVPVGDIAERLGTTARSVYRYLAADGVDVTPPDNWRRKPRPIEDDNNEEDGWQ